MKARNLHFRVGRSLLLVVCLAMTAAAQDEVFPVPEGFETEGVPVLKKSQVSNYSIDSANIRSNLLWDADTTNRRLLVTDATNGAYLVDAPMANPRLLLGKIAPLAAKFRPGTRDFAYLSDHEDEDNYQLYYFDSATGTSRALAPKSTADDAISALAWSPNGKEIYYARVDYEKKSSRFCVHDLTRETCVDRELDGTWEVVTADERNVVLKFWNSSSNQQLFLLNLAKKSLDPLQTEGNNRRASLVGGILIWSNEGDKSCGGDPCVMVRPGAKGKSSVLKLPAKLMSIQDLKLSPNGRYLELLEIRDGIDRLHVYELRGERVVREMPPLAEPSYVIWHTRWLSGSELAFTVEHVGKPASIRSYDFKSGRWTDWTKDRLPAGLQDKLAPPAPIKWKSYDGKEISGFVIKPKVNTGRLPVVIFVHGGPQVLDRPVFNSEEATLVSALGVAVIHTNIRGSSGLGREFMDADDKEKRGDAIADVRSLLDWVQKQPDLDAGRIILRGQSYGGFVVLATGLAEPDRVKAVIAEFPLVSIRGLVSMSWADESVFAEYGDPKDEQLMKKLDNLSPLGNAARWNKIPLFLTRGKRDERNPEQNVIDLKNQLKASGADVWFIYSNDAGHGVGGPYVTAALFQFIKNNLEKGELK